MAKWGIHFDLANLRQRARELEEKTHAADFWQSPEVSQGVLKTMKAIKDKLAAYDAVAGLFDDASTFLEMGLSENDGAAAQEAREAFGLFVSAYEDLRIGTLLAGEYDGHNAIVALHPGAGGTESCDWAGMLLRMYGKWAEKKGFKFELLDIIAGDEAGVKSATFQVSGPSAFGLLRSEKGIHRLVRVSPFDSGGRRHTSFASCDVMPEIAESEAQEISAEELKVDTYRSGGAGGQHVNKTESAIRITHIPTGIIVACQSERSQIQNRAKAMNILRSRIFVRQKEERMEKLSGIRGETKDNAWGSQIRSYVFHPYSMVKDHRTGEETGSAQAVMDGALDPFINAYLLWQAKAER